MLDNKSDILILIHLIKSPDKKFHVNELYASLKLNRKMKHEEEYGRKAIASLIGNRMIRETPTEIPLEKKYQITDKGVKALKIHFRESVYKFLLWKKEKEFTVENLQGFYSFEVDQEMLIKVTNDIVKEKGIIRTIHSNDGELKFVITEKGQKERERETRRTLSGIRRKAKKKESSKTFYVDEVGLGGQVVRSYSTSKGELKWVIICIAVFTVVAILALVLMTEFR